MIFANFCPVSFVFSTFSSNFVRKFRIYRQKMEDFIHSTQDKTLKYQFESSYELAIEQIASYQ